MGALHIVKNPCRAVLDTNTVMSALLFSNGSLSGIRHAWQSGAIVPLISKSTAQELIRALSYPKFKLIADERECLLADYLPYCESITHALEKTPVPGCRNPHDTMFLILALAGNADCLVTGDQDLLSLAGDFTTPIMTPAALRT